MKKILSILLLVGFTAITAQAGEPPQRPFLARVINSLNPFAPDPAAQSNQPKKVKKYKPQKAIPNTYHTN